MAAEKQLSVIVPAYNEQTRLPNTLRRIIEYLDASGMSFELIVVDDGSADGTVRVSEQVFGDRDDCRVVRHPVNLGKGAAVRTGLQEA